jgi:hypothetical protein
MCIVSSYENSFMHNTIGFFFQESALAKNFPIYISVTPTIFSEKKHIFFNALSFTAIWSLR